MQCEKLFSTRAHQLKSSAIREILKVTANPDVISFAGGLPAPESFPVAQMKAAFDAVLSKEPQAALQYSTTDGYAPLREWVAKRMSSGGANIVPEQVIIVSGSQQALDLIAKVFIDTGDKVLVETPTYLGALQAFSMFQPNYVSIDSDENGLNADAITADVAKDAKFLYALPNFQNPTGRMMSEERRAKLVEKVREHDLLVVEDDPYGELWYESAPPASLLSRMPERVIHMGSFSKVLAPGLRLGYLIAPIEITQKFEQTKQATDLHTSTIAQRVVYEVVKDGFLEEHIPLIRERYKNQAHTMLDALSHHMPSGVKWNQPAGGMFLWLTLPEGLDSERILAQVIKQNVAYVPGTPFYANNPQHNTLRLAFVTVPAEKIQAGIKILGQAFAKL
ncbi:PLP-dependent aminotransferase family protein [Hydromonas duriensis]|uniref:Valine-pyruvate aminotransferase n=1 Tax=Hydromonas duriensis TaxID=1527608 RepID=A0A4R6Y9N9_9BURK|nr:PLP-dependent aminotransferase family protein [Hydromonas duriensis]TDR32170.1 valine-pyruvate aminotransferase [Hydromonas duriensis]